MISRRSFVKALAAAGVFGPVALRHGVAPDEVFGDLEQVAVRIDGRKVEQVLSVDVHAPSAEVVADDTDEWMITMRREPPRIVVVTAAPVWVGFHDFVSREVDVAVSDARGVMTLQGRAFVSEYGTDGPSTYRTVLRGTGPM